MAHSAEPWMVGRTGTIVVAPSAQALQQYPKMIQRDLGVLVAESMSQDDRDRSLACVNACAGLPEVALRPRVFIAMLKMIRGMVAEMEKDPGSITHTEREYLEICKDLVTRFKVDEY